MFSQGVPFFHAGDDLLRSKSLDRNSYNSGDWYNRVDWTAQSSNWGVGLPVEGTERWDLMRPLLADPALRPAPADIQFAAAYFRELLQIRRSSPLFRLRTADQILHALTFLNSGPDATPGLIVMRLTDVDGLDENFEEIVVLFNARPEAVAFADESLKGVAFELHPLQQNSVDAVVQSAAFDPAGGEFTVPGRTAAVFVVKAAAAPAAEAASVATSAAPTAPATAAAPTPGLQWASWALVGLIGLAVLGGLAWARLTRQR